MDIAPLDPNVILEKVSLSSFTLCHYSHGFGMIGMSHKRLCGCDTTVLGRWHISGSFSRVIVNASSFSFFHFCFLNKNRGLFKKMRVKETFAQTLVQEFSLKAMNNSRFIRKFNLFY